MAEIEIVRKRRKKKGKNKQETHDRFDEVLNANVIKLAFPLHP
jgi:hypothetical protein